MADWEPELELKLGCELNDGAAGCEGWLLNDGEGWDGRLNEDVGCWGRLNEEGGGREEGLGPLGEDNCARELGIQRKICICACNQAILDKPARLTIVPDCQIRYKKTNSETVTLSRQST